MAPPRAARLILASSDCRLSANEEQSIARGLEAYEEQLPSFLSFIRILLMIRQA